ncbi:MAG: L-threonylcarbamoyladenylate synthase [Desulfobulbaceae bacterium]|nr:L-threonylcarbamoyladenylate synthase [Desulfobulbaceae bacterium]
MIDSEVKKAGEVLMAGGIILYPTDTIWGIGCDATNMEAVQLIYDIKQRDDSKSMLVLVNGVKMLKEYLHAFPPQALELIARAEKPTTIIYPGARKLASNLLANDGSMGIRITSDPFCQSLIEFTGKPIVSTSANISGEPSPALFSEILPHIRQQVDHVVNRRQDETEPSSPSAIIKLEAGGGMTILRP